MKKKMLKLCGAELHLVEALPYKNPGNYIRYSETLSKKTTDVTESFRFNIGTTF